MKFASYSHYHVHCPHLRTTNNRRWRNGLKKIGYYWVDVGPRHCRQHLDIWMRRMHDPRPPCSSGFHKCIAPSSRLSSPGNFLCGCYRESTFKPHQPSRDGSQIITLRFSTGLLAQVSRWSDYWFTNDAAGISTLSTCHWPQEHWRDTD